MDSVSRTESVAYGATTTHLVNGHEYLTRTTRYVGRCTCGKGATALVLQRAMAFRPDHWTPLEGDGYTLHNGVYVACPCGRSVSLQAVDGRYKPEIACSDKCRNAIGPSCDCSCGGENHGCNH